MREAVVREPSELCTVLAGPDCSFDDDCSVRTVDVLGRVYRGHPFVVTLAKAVSSAAAASMSESADSSDSLPSMACATMAPGGTTATLSEPTATARASSTRERARVRRRRTPRGRSVRPGRRRRGRPDRTGPSVRHRRHHSPTVAGGSSRSYTAARRSPKAGGISIGSPVGWLSHTFRSWAADPVALLPTTVGGSTAVAPASGIGRVVPKDGAGFANAVREGRGSRRWRNFVSRYSIQYLNPRSR